MVTCAKCKAEIPDGKAIYIQTASKQVMPLCPTCDAAFDRILDAEEQDPNLFLGAGLGVLAGGLTAALWQYVSSGTRQLLGVAPIVIGWLVAQAVILGSGRKRGLRVQIVSVTITLIALAAAEALIAPVFFPPADSSLFALFKAVGSHISANLLLIVFWGIGLFEAWSLPAPRRLKKVPKPSS